MQSWTIQAIEGRVPTFRNTDVLSMAWHGGTLGRLEVMAAALDVI